jgi:hypothetical protein
MDGTWLASGSSDRTVRLWDAATGVLLQTFQGRTRHVKFSADSKLLWTDFGQFVVSEDEFHHDRDHVLLKPVRHTLQLQEEWIQHDGNDILWLPHDFRGTCSAVYGKTLVIGQSFGAVSLFRAQDVSHIAP